MDSEKEIEKKKENVELKIKSIFNNIHLLLFVAVLIFAIIVSLYFFSKTSSQPLWWDEAEYMSMAKHFAYGVPYDLNPQRPPLFSFLASLLFIIGLSDTSIKFLIVLVPFILSVILTYFFIKDVYDERVALIAMLITSVSWIHLFYSMRFMTDAIGLLFGLASFYCFWKGYVNKGSKIYIWLVGLFVSLAIMIRLTGVLYGAVIFLFLLFTDKFKFLKNKNLWISLFIAIITLIPLFVYDYSTFNNPVAFKSGYGGTPNQPLGWQLINEVYSYPELVFFILFLVGIILSLKIFLSLDIIIKKEDKKGLGDIFMIITLVFILAFFIYFLRQAENRWLIAMSIPIFVFASKGSLWIYDKIKKKNKIVGVIVILIILISGVYFELQHANQIILIKKDSYLQIKDAATWIKDNSNKEDVVLSVSLPQTIYYSERRVYTYSELNQSDLFHLIKEKNPRYIIVSNIEPHHPQWIYSWLQGNQDKFVPKKIFTDSQNNAFVAVFEINKNFINSLG